MSTYAETIRPILQLVDLLQSDLGEVVDGDDHRTVEEAIEVLGAVEWGRVLDFREAHRLAVVAEAALQLLAEHCETVGL